MKNPIRRTMPIAIMLLIGTVTSFAQLKVSLNMNSHPDPYLSNWPNMKNTVIVTVTNSGKSPVDAKFDCKVNLNGALEAHTKPESMRVLQIDAGVTQFFAEDLVPFEAVKVVNGADRTAIKTGMLAAGEYEFCVSLIDPKTNAGLTPLVCKNFTLSSYLAPVPLLPENNSTLGKTNRLPTFRWSGLSPKYPSVVSYRMVVSEVLKGQTPVTAFRMNIPILDKTVPGVQLMWPADVELPQGDKQYVWGVQALDDSGNPIIKESNGWSELFSFIACCKEETKTVDSLNTTTKQNEITLLSPGVGERISDPRKLTFSWKPTTSVSQRSKLSYTVQITEVLGSESADAAFTRGNLWFERKDISGTMYEYPSSAKKLEDGRTFAWKVASFQDGQSIGNSNARSFMTSFCGGIMITSALQCAGVGTNLYDFTLTCVNPADPNTDPNCVMVVNTVAMQQLGIPVNVTTPLPLNIQPGQTVNIIGQIGPTSLSGNFSIAVTGPSFTATYSPAFTLPVPPSAPGIIAGLSTVCSGQSGVSYSISAVNEATSYVWTVPTDATITSGQGTTSVTVDFGTMSGNVCVSAINSCGASPISCKPIILGIAPETPVAVLGPSNVCASQSGIVYSIPSVSGATSYLWAVPSGISITSGQGSTSITVTSGLVTGNISICVSAVNSCGSSSSSCIPITVASTPLISGTINGDATVCSGQAGIVYYVSPLTGTSYTWTVPIGATITSGLGTHSIVVTFGSNSGNFNICVVPANGCGTSAPICKSITVNSPPSTPGAITGPNSVCAGQTNVLYSIPAVSGATFYNWTHSGGLNISSMGQGTNALTVTFGSVSGSMNLCVTALNDCGVTTQSCIPISIFTLPPAPTATAATGIQTTQFNAHWTAIANATGYYLDVATDAAFTSYLAGYQNKSLGIQTSYILIGLTCNTSYYYRLRSVGLCGTSVNSNSITVHTSQVIPQPPTAYGASGTQGTQFTASWSSVAGAIDYYIDVYTIVGGITNYVTGYQNKSIGLVTNWIVTGLTCNTTYKYRVRAARPCGTSVSSYSVTVNTSPPLTPGVITGLSSICSGQSGISYSISTVDGANSYVWTAPSDASITTGQGTNSITVTYGSSSGNICVAAINSCGASTQRCIPITIITVPPAPIATAAIGIQANQFMANWSAVTGATVYLLDISTDANFSSFSTVYLGTATTHPTTGLNCSTVYYYRIHAHGVCGDGGYSNTIMVVTSPSTPPIPIASGASGIQGTQFTANWLAVGGAIGYYIDVYTIVAGVTTYVAGFQNKNVGTVTTCIVTGLNCNTIYKYRVRAIGPCGTSASSYSSTVKTIQPISHGSWTQGPGNYSFTVAAIGTPADINGCPGQSIPITMEVWGAGGGGGGGEDPMDQLYIWYGMGNNDHGGSGGGGGGGGGYAKTTINVTIPFSGILIFYANVGIGGGSGPTSVVGGVNVADGGQGGSSKVSNSMGAILSAIGGHGGSYSNGGAGGWGTINNWPGQPGGNGAQVTTCNGGGGGSGGSGGGPDRIGPGYFNDGGNGGHGGYFHNLWWPTCTDHGMNYELSTGNVGGNGRVVFTW